MSYVLVVGECVVDIVTNEQGTTVERPGGSAANVAVALSRLGRQVRLATAFADDERGAMIGAHLASAGVELACDPHVIDRTSTAAALIHADGSATYEFDLDWRIGSIRLCEPPAFVHVCSIGAVLPPGAKEVLALLDRLASGARPPVVTYDVNARPTITGTGPGLIARIHDVVRRSHVVKASDEDLITIDPSSSVADAALRLLSLGPQAVVVTRGAHGSTWFTRDGTVSSPAAAAHVVDTIGAGDTFAAATVDALWSGLEPAQTIAYAGRAAAVTVSRVGADPPTRADIGWR